jgi:hypothetical protein
LAATSGTRRSDALYEAAVKRLPGGSTRSTVYVPPSPPYALRGEGHMITDAGGHQVIDLQGNMTALVHGHAHPAIVSELRAAVADGLSFGMPSESEVVLAGELVRRIDIVERVRFASSGTEAVMLALRVARAYTGRQKILRFEGCYHGLYDPIVATGARGVAPQTWQAVVTVPVGDEATFGRGARRARRRARVRDRRPDAEPARPRAGDTWVRAPAPRRDTAPWDSAARRRGDHVPARGRRAPVAVRAPTRPRDAREDDRRRSANRRLRRLGGGDGRHGPA